MIEQAERQAIESVLERFAAQIDRVLFGAAEGADGDLARVPELIGAARELGLLADADPTAPGSELGVWGSDCAQEGSTRSLLALARLGEACAGFAAAVHAQGLACLAAGGQARLSGATPAAAFSPHYGVPLSARAPAGSQLLLSGTPGAGCELNGSAYFLLAAAAPDQIVCFAQGDGAQAWNIAVVDAQAGGVELEAVSQRTGLRAAQQYHLHCTRVRLPADQLLCTGTAALNLLQRVIACDWLGHAAIALGVARRALRDARGYTAQRFQGGRTIAGHAGVQLLLGTAEYDIALLEAVLECRASEPLAAFHSKALLRWALQAKLAIGEHAFRAVTNCLQTLGGYGYMEDYRFEKRLRDVSVLRSLHGAPDQLRLFLDELAPAEPSGGR